MYTVKELKAMKPAQVEAVTQKAQAFLVTVYSADEMSEILTDAAQSLPGLRVRQEVRIAAYLCTEVETAFTKTHHQISPETIQRGGYLSGDVFSTTDYNAIVAVFA